MVKWSPQMIGAQEIQVRLQPSSFSVNKIIIKRARPYVVYFDQLSDVARTLKLVETFFQPFLTNNNLELTCNRGEVIQEYRYIGSDLKLGSFIQILA